MNHEDHAFCFPCGGAAMYGVLSMPALPGSRGVLIAVGGPQYRIGSHRQFVLLARAFAAAGHPVLRFDYRGMGDSEGDTRSFEEVGQDIQAAIDQFLAAAPSVQEIVVLGLCDGATAAMLYAHHDPRISGLVLINPWAHTEAGEAKARLKHYYRARLADAELWRKIAHGNFDLRGAVCSLFISVRNAFFPAGAGHGQQSLTDRLYQAYRLFRGEVLLILCSDDLTAQEFLVMTRQNSQWRALMRSPRIECFVLPEANHTFSRREWRDEIAKRTTEWLGARSCVRHNAFSPPAAHPLVDCRSKLRT